jgi:5-carboxyvanillate decarboxylase
MTDRGMAWEPAIKFAQEVMGSDHVPYAMDCPQQFDIDEVVTTDNLSISDYVKKLLNQTNAEQMYSLRKA